MSTLPTETYTVALTADERAAVMIALTTYIVLPDPPMMFPACRDELLSIIKKLGDAVMTQTESALPRGGG